MRAFSAILSVAIITLSMSACSKKKPTSFQPGKRSTTTGAKYNAKKEGGFTVAKFNGQTTGPNLVFIEGGRFTMGSLEEDVMHTGDNLERTVSIQSFYMDEAEIGNIHWLEYLTAVQKDSSQEFYESVLPDSTVWANEMSFNDTYVTQYLRHPGFRYYPVVGVSWQQANDYCKWRTGAANEVLSQGSQKTKKGMKMPSFGKKNKNKAAEVAAAQASAKQGRLRIESGLVLPEYRLPSEAEWEYAAKALIGTQDIDENQSNSRIYPWDGSSMRKNKGKKQGTMMANYKRGRGDYAGIAGRSNDGAIITQEIFSFSPNDFGLYNMAGNVNEWVYDLYRPNSYRDMNDLNPIRRSDYLDEAKNYDTKNFNSLIDNKQRVYKGGSWSDVAYWLSPGTRRYLDQDSSTATIGFRCAMIAVAPSSKSKKR